MFLHSALQFTFMILQRPWVNTGQLAGVEEVASRAVFVPVDIFVAVYIGSRSSLAFLFHLLQVSARQHQYYNNQKHSINVQ